MRRGELLALNWSDIDFDNATLDITPHGLRHTHISNLLNIGVPLISVSNRAGHKNMETTARVYAGLIKPRDNSEHLSYMNQITDLQNQTS